MLNEQMGRRYTMSSHLCSANLNPSNVTLLQALGKGLSKSGSGIEKFVGHRLRFPMVGHRPWALKEVAKLRT